MLDALSAALFKTTGDEQFKTEEKKPDPDEKEWGTMKRETYYPDVKYKYKTIGEIGSSSEYVDDTCA